MIEFTQNCDDETGTFQMLRKLHEISGLVGVFAAGGMAASLIVGMLAMAK